jgi:glycerol-3-phosphate responsive antiterminator
MGNEAMIKILKDLIKEVKEENKGKVLTEGLVKEEDAVLVERKALKQYVTKNLIETLKDAED